MLFEVILVSAIVVTALVVFAYSRSRDKKLWTTESEATETTEKLGYKVAVMPLIKQQDDGKIDIQFEGLAGIEYGVRDEAQSEDKGFHIYDSFYKAFRHPQPVLKPGKIFLEVIGHGALKTHRIGFKATEQRVLQVMVGQCRLCPNQATHHREHQEIKIAILGANLFTRGGLKCSKHATDDYVDLRPMMLNQQETVERDLINICPLISPVEYEGKIAPLFQPTIITPGE